MLVRNIKTNTTSQISKPQNLNPELAGRYSSENKNNRNEISFRARYALPPIARNFLDAIDNLEGIQNGIGAFKGYNIREICTTISDSVILALRGCPGGCLHCCAEAKKPLADSQIDFEDMISLTNGIKTLKDRIPNKFLREQFMPVSRDALPSTVLFYDGDCIRICSRGLDGKEHNFIELNDLMYKATGNPGLFVTAGFDKNDKYAMETAAQMAKKYSEDNSSISSINVSINPFYRDGLKAAKAALTKRDELKGSSAEDVLLKLVSTPEPYRDKQAQKIANTLFEFLPILDKPFFTLQIRAATEGDVMDELFGAKRLNELFEKIQMYFEQMCIDDGMSPKSRFISSPQQVAYYGRVLNEKLYDYTISPVVKSGRYAKLCKSVTGKDVEAKYFPEKVIDINGKLSIFSPNACHPTELGLNYRRPNRVTAELGKKGNELPREALRDDAVFFLLNPNILKQRPDPTELKRLINAGIIG